MLAVHEHENQLIQLVREGDLSAWGELIRIHQDRLYNSIVRVVGHPDRARDVVQDTFIQAIENISRFDGKSQFFTWLYRIAFNRAMSMYRKHKAEVSLDLARENAGDETMADSQDQPEDRVLQSELVEEVHQALEQLSAEHRAEALAACAWLIDSLKHVAPIFKKEHFEGGEVWIGSLADCEHE